MQKLFAIVALALCVGACGSAPVASTTTEKSPRPTTGITTPPTTAITTPPTTAITTPPTTRPVVSRVEVIGGEVSGPGRIEISLGSEAVFVVASDVADEVHVHGYDLSYDVAAEGEIEVRFLADVPGVFEVEMERGHLPLVELVVSP